MNHNHRQQRDQHEHDDLLQLEQAIRNKQLTGNRTIDRLISTVPRPDASRRDALEAYLVAQLTPESERKESELMDMPVEFKRKNKPKPRHRGRNIGIAAVVTVVMGLFGWIFAARPDLNHVIGPGFSMSNYSGALQPENTSEADAAFYIATRLSAEATRDAGTASANSITGPESDLLTITAIVRDATVAQIAPTLTAIDAANARLAELNDFQATATKIIQEVTQTAEAIWPVSDDERTATALIQEVTQVYLDQTATAEVVFFSPSNATATAEAIFANMSMSGDVMTATALIQEITQVFVDQTSTAAMILGSPVPLATPTPEPNLIGVGQTIHIPLVRIVAYDDRTQPVFAEGQRLLLFTELRPTKYQSIRRVEEAGDLSALETPLLSSTARIVKIHEGPVGNVPMSTIEVQVDASEYAVLKWFVENTGLQFLFIASPIVTVP